MTTLILFRRPPMMNCFGPCFSLSIHNGLPRSIMRFFLFQNNVLGLLMRERNLIGTRVSLPKRRQRVAPFYHLSQLSHSRDSDFHSSSSPGFLTPKMTELVVLAIRFIIGLDFAVIRSSPESF